MNLCDIYPKTAMSLKYRSLDRRNYFMKHMQQQEQEFGIDRDPKTGMKRKDNKIHTLDEEITFKDEIQDYTKIKLLRCETEIGAS